MLNLHKEDKMASSTSMFDGAFIIKLNSSIESQRVITILFNFSSLKMIIDPKRKTH